VCFFCIHSSCYLPNKETMSLKLTLDSVVSFGLRLEWSNKNASNKHEVDCSSCMVTINEKKIYNMQKEKVSYDPVEPRWYPTDFHHERKQK
jgi:hypothetical protein